MFNLLFANVCIYASIHAPLWYFLGCGGVTVLECCFSMHSSAQGSNIQESSCCICKDTLSLPIVKCGSCRHSFHQECMRVWCAQHSICPLCRKSIWMYLQNNVHAQILVNSCTLALLPYVYVMYTLCQCFVYFMTF